MTVRYPGWWDVPAHMMPATALSELEFPRSPTERPHAVVEVRADWRGKESVVALYDARLCPPTKSTGGQLAAAAAKSKRSRVCADCGAHCQRPLRSLGDVLPERTGLGVPEPDHEVIVAALRDSGRPLCPACRAVALLRVRQAELVAARPGWSRRAEQLLGWAPAAAVVQVDLTTPPRSPGGRSKPPTAGRIRAVDLDGKKLVDLTVRMVGPRARHIPESALDPGDAVPSVHAALLDRRLIAWSHEDLVGLAAAAPSGGRWPASSGAVCWGAGHPAGHDRVIGEWVRAAVVHQLATEWRGQLELRTRTLVDSVPPGSPDRTLLLLQRIAGASAPGP